MKFASARLNYRLLEERDRDTFIALYQDPKVMRKIGPILSRDQAIEFFAKFLNSNSVRRPSQLLWIMHERNTENFVGIIMLKSLDTVTDAEIGIMLLPTFSRREFGFEAVDKLIRFSHEKLGVTGFCANFDKGHKPVRQILTRLGFCFTEQQACGKSNQVRATRESVV